VRADSFLNVHRPPETGFSGDMLVVNSDGSSFSWPPVAAIKASAVAG
jgi:hypothetical protein